MRSFELDHIDLNLLKAFDALERERSVTRAAAALGLGQPAMSHALARLRDLVGDPLFVRAGAGMAPTPRAMELIGPIRTALQAIASVLEGGVQFDPAAESVLTLGLSDYLAGAIVPKLLVELQALAPSMNLVVKAADRRDAGAKLDRKEIDLAVGLFPEAAEWHRREPLYLEDHVCVFSPRRLSIGEDVTVAHYRDLPHVLVSLPGDRRGFIDDILDDIDTPRRVWVTVPYFLLVGEILEKTSALATLPRSLAEYCSYVSNLEMRELPFESPRFEVSMLWHMRDERDEKLRLVRRAVTDVCKSFT